MRLIPVFLAALMVANIATGQVKQAKAWLGVAIEQGKSGVLIMQILPETPAENSGLKKGDEIVEVDAKKVSTPKELIQTIQNKGIGHEVKIKFLRNAKPQTKSIKLVQKPGELDLVKKKLLNHPAPEFQLTNFATGKKLSLADTKGKVVILEFWATWCPACVASHADLSKFQKDNPGIEVLAVSTEDKATLQSYQKQMQPKFTIAQDPEGKTSGDWMVRAIPMFGVLDKSGVVRHIGLGGGTYLQETLAIATKLNK